MMAMMSQKTIQLNTLVGKLKAHWSQLFTLTQLKVTSKTSYTSPFIAHVIQLYMLPL